MNHDQYETEAIAVEAWATRMKCIENINLPPCEWRRIRHREIDALAEAMKDALFAYFCMDAAEPTRVRREGGSRG
jgi:hypothetical protein